MSSEDLPPQGPGENELTNEDMPYGWACCVCGGTFAGEEPIVACPECGDIEVPQGD